MARIGPSVFVEALSRRRDILDVARDDAALVASKFRNRIAAPAYDPRQISLPEKVRGFGEHHVEIEPAVGGLLVFPVVIVPAEAEAFGGHPCAELRQLLAERAPLRLAAVPFPERGAGANTVCTPRSRQIVIVAARSARRRSRPTWQVGAVMPC